MVLIERLVQFRIVFRRRPMLYDTVVTTALTIVGKGVGFIVPIFIARWYGATADTDAFFFVYTLVFFFIGVYANAVESTIVPFVAELKTNVHADKLEGAFVGGLLTLSAVSMSVLTVSLVLISRPLLPYVTQLGDLDLVHRLLIEVSPLILLVTTSSIMNGVLNAHKVFWLPAFSPAVRGLVVLTGAWSLRGQSGIHALALSYVIAEFLRVLLALAVLKWTSHLHIVFSLRPSIKLVQFAGNALALSAGTTVIGMTPLIDKAIASFIATGSITLLEYARTLFFVPVAALSSGFLVVSLSHRAEQFYATRGHNTKEIFLLALRPLALICIAGAVGGALTRHYIASLVYGKTLTNPQVAIVGDTFGWLLLSLLPYMLGSYFAQAFIITRSIVPLVRWSALSVALLAVLDVALARQMGVPGIAVSNFITYVVLATGLYMQMPTGEPGKT